MGMFEQNSLRWASAKLSPLLLVTTAIGVSSSAAAGVATTAGALDALVLADRVYVLFDARLFDRPLPLALPPLLAQTARNNTTV